MTLIDTIDEFIDQLNRRLQSIPSHMQIECNEALTKLCIVSTELKRLDDVKAAEDAKKDSSPVKSSSDSINKNNNGEKQVDTYRPLCSHPTDDDHIYGD